MPVKHIPCRNTETGATAEIPETALDHMSNWRPVGGGEPMEPSDRTSLADPPQPPADPDVAGEPDTAAAPAARTSTAKSTAADTAKTEKRK